MEIRSGVGRRRRWSDEEKGRIVAESYGPSAVVSEVARRHEISPQHLFVWRKAARDGRLALPADEATMFVPVVMATQKPVAPKQSAPSIAIETAGIVVRAECGVDVGWLADVLRVVKALR
jgi:transposase